MKIKVKWISFEIWYSSYAAILQLYYIWQQIYPIPTFLETPFWIGFDPTTIKHTVIFTNFS